MKERGSEMKESGSKMEERLSEKGKMKRTKQKNTIPETFEHLKVIFKYLGSCRASTVCEKKVMYTFICFEAKREKYDAK
jgi:hypothetical protein